VARELEFDDKTTAVLAARDERPAPASFRIRVVGGSDAGKEVVLDESRPPVLVGQSPACDLRLADRAVSRRHVRLEIVGGRLRLTDLGSRNGTFVDAVQVIEVLLPPGATVTVGSTVLRVESSEPRPQAPPAAQSFGSMLGGSVEMRRLYPLCARLAAVAVPVLIEGETGTGKEVLAESLHAMGPRAGGPYVVFDCTAVPPSMVEATLFGHERGSFTGAVTARSGVFERAHGGTLLIDEIGDLDISLQPKLLRVVERGEVQRLGASAPIKVDVRLLAATRRDLDREIQAGRFRDDLFHRLAVARVELPPLRRRQGDVRLLAAHFCKQLGHEPSAIAPELLQRWLDAEWPGNVRELKNAVARHLMLGELGETGTAPFEIDLEEGGQHDASLLEWLDRCIDPGLPLVQARQRVIEQFENRYITRLLEAHGGSVKDAAKAAGVAKRYFQLLKARIPKS